MFARRASVVAPTSGFQFDQSGNSRRCWSSGPTSKHAIFGRGQFFFRAYPYVWWYETPGLKRTLCAPGGIAAFPVKAPAFAPVCPLSKTRSARPGFPNPVSLSRWSFYGGESACVFSGAAALNETRA